MERPTRGPAGAVGTGGNGALPGGARCGVSPTPLKRQGTLACPAGPPSLVGLYGEAVLLSWYLACGPLVGTLVTARPPAGRAGDVGRYPLGKGREEPFGFPLSPSVNKPLLPPARAGGRAMRRRSWRPQARPYLTNHLPPFPPTREWGSKEGTSFPLVFFPLFLQKERAPAGKPPFPAVPTAQWKNTKNQPLPSPGTAGFLCVLASLTPPSSAQTPAGSPWRPSSRRAGSGWLQWPPQ